ncbi:hypothetical protein F0562_025087 [Nyssa sinensis]|uniref:Uncharacterized protein n=1 Tax=Nyssa sinensis TaxID=561372 RepID=A0A5J5BHB4_9ASTE|nr:hypothetical protein F0562_025087 [Nyssa sinensis]
MVGAVAKEDTEVEAVIHFVGVIWTKRGPVGAPEGTEEGIVWSMFKEEFKWSFVLNDGRREVIYEIGGNDEGIIPILVQEVGWEVSVIELWVLENWGWREFGNVGRIYTNKWQLYGQFWSRFDIEPYKSSREMGSNLVVIEGTSESYEEWRPARRDQVISEELSG